MPTGYEQDMWKAVRTLAQQSLEQTKAAERRNDLLEQQNKLLTEIVQLLQAIRGEGKPRL